MDKVKMLKNGALALTIASVLVASYKPFGGEGDATNAEEPVTSNNEVTGEELNSSLKKEEDDYIANLVYVYDDYDESLRTHNFVAWEASRDNLKVNDWTSDLYGSTEVTHATAEELNSLIKSICKKRGLDTNDNILIGKGSTLVEIEDEYGVSAVCCLSIWTWESGFGESDLAKTNNNLGGITNKNGRYKKFDTVDECMLYQAELLRNNYIDKGYVKYSEIGSKYCPLDPKWGTNVGNTAKGYAELLEGIMC